MPRDWRIPPTPRSENAKKRVSRVSARQFGRISRRQLDRLEVSNGLVGRWVAESYLHRVLPGVYGVGHLAASFEADLAAALLYAGPGAALSHATATWWLKLSERRPITIDVTTPRRVASLDGIRVHDRRARARSWVRDLPATTVAETLLDVGAEAGIDELRYLVAQAEYRRLLNLDEIAGALGSGRRGSRKLRKALSRHLPALARARSVLEIDFILFCERHRLPLPEVNVVVEGVRVDALWRSARVVVELDGRDGHAAPAQLERDRRRDLLLRGAGYTVLRYTWSQIQFDAAAVASDLRQALRQRGTPA
jgi:hypothetical protein